MSVQIRGEVNSLDTHDFRGMLALSFCDVANGGQSSDVETETLYLSPETADFLRKRLASFLRDCGHKKTRIVWERIKEPNCHGWQASVGNRTAEVVRCYAAEWAIFCKRDGQILRSPGAPKHVSASAAKKLARIFLETGSYRGI